MCCTSWQRVASSKACLKGNRAKNDLWKNGLRYSPREVRPCVDESHVGCDRKGERAKTSCKQGWWCSACPREPRWRDGHWPSTQGWSGWNWMRKCWYRAWMDDNEAGPRLDPWLLGRYWRFLGSGSPEAILSFCFPVACLLDLLGHYVVFLVLWSPFSVEALLKCVLLVLENISLVGGYCCVLKFERGRGLAILGNREMLVSLGHWEKAIHSLTLFWHFVRQGILSARGIFNIYISWITWL